MPQFQCQHCGKAFEVAQRALDKYPGWKPKICIGCRDTQLGKPKRARKPAPRAAPTSGRRPANREENLTVAQVLEKYSDGPRDGVFTDGAAHPNPGPGGWGAVYVEDGRVIAETYGHEPHTTNNRMELVALIEGFKLVPPEKAAVVWTDSQLCFNTITKWARTWERSGWKRKTGAIKNLDLVQELYSMSKQRPELELRWIPAHSGHRWNEYADALATAYRRTEK